MRLGILGLLLAMCPVAAPAVEPVIDMHLHADAIDNQGPPPMAMCTPLARQPLWDQRTPYPPQFLDEFKHPRCKDPVWSPTTDEALMRETIAEMDRAHVVLGVLSGSADRVVKWRAAAPGRFLSGLSFQLADAPSVSAIRGMIDAGRLDALAEVGTQYEGIAPTDPRLEPYWALAEERDIPVGIHIGPGPPGVAYLGSGMRARLSSALTLEEVLIRHPRLRVYVMHAGWPMGDDMLALLYNHPQVYVDTGVIAYTRPRADFYGYIKRLTDAGYGDRIMFGSDQMVWPGTIGRAIAVIRADPYLTPAQKRAILYDNAARFLRLTPQQIAAHHRR